MDYEKKYKDALAKAKEYFTPDTPDRVDTKGCLVNIFPELAESEDERIRKELLIDIPKVFPYEKANRYIAYLEKQKDIITDYEDRLDRCACDNFNKGFKTGVEKQKEQKSEEWSEEDNYYIDSALKELQSHLDTASFEPSYRRKIEKGISVIKSLRPTCKPSEEQMKELLFAEKIIRNEGFDYTAAIIGDLYNELKQL